MIAYFDTSALVPLVVGEPTSHACREMWDAADDVVCVRIAYVEVYAALAMAERLGRISAREADVAVDVLDDMWSGVSILEFDQELASEAAACARRFELRGYDAVHCAAAMALADDETVAVSGDGALLSAWERAGVVTRNTNL